MTNIDQGQLLAGIAAASDDCILFLDADCAIVWASPSTEQALGWPAQELVGRDMDVLFSRENAELRGAALERLFAGERVEPYVDIGARHGGTRFEAKVMLGPVRGPDGLITGAVAILREVTAQETEQRELALALDISRAHFDRVATPQASVDLRGHLESVNPAWCELFGHDDGWFVDCDLLELVHPVDTVNVVARLDRLRAGEIDSTSYRGRFRDAEGKTLSLLVDAAVLREANGSPYAIVASVADPSELEDEHDPARARRQLSEVLVRRALDTAVVLGDGLTVTYLAGSVARMLHYRADDPLRRVSWEYVHAADAPVVAGMLMQLLAEPRKPERAVVRVRDGEQQWRSIEVTATNCLDDPEIGGIVANLRDVTERVRTEEALRTSEALHRAMVETAHAGIMATSAEGRVIFANETAAEIVGRPAGEMYGEDPEHMFGLPAEDLTAEVRVHEVHHRRPDGCERILQVSRRPLNSHSGGLGSLVSISDITDARQAERTLRRRALHDPLTLLPNRYLFRDRLETAAARQHRFDGYGTAVLFVDLDRFKQVNDRFGHEAGDGVLREVAARLLAAVRATDTVGRLGGDEFAVICEHAGLEEAMLVAERICAAFEEPVQVGDDSHPTRLSIGVALAPPHPFDQLVSRADAAMYRAKQLGGAQIFVAEVEENQVDDS